MNRMRVAVLAVACAAGGCTTARFYPVCVLDTGYGSMAELWDRTRLRVDEVVSAVTHGHRPVRLDREGALVLATPSDQAALARVWPQYACTIADDDVASRNQLLDDCRRSVTAYLRSGLDFWPATPLMGAPCATAAPSPSSARTPPH